MPPCRSWSLAGQAWPIAWRHKKREPIVLDPALTSNCSIVAERHTIVDGQSKQAVPAASGISRVLPAAVPSPRKNRNCPPLFPPGPHSTQGEEFGMRSQRSRRLSDAEAAGGNRGTEPTQVDISLRYPVHRARCVSFCVRRVGTAAIVAPMAAQRGESAAIIRKARRGR